MRIGYARVSTADQNPDLQEDALQKAECEKIFRDVGLNLVVAAIVLWNTAYLDRALQVLQQEGVRVPEECLSHISPLGWEHITITGTYHWKGVDRQWKRFRPLRQEFLEQLKVKSA